MTATEVGDTLAVFEVLEILDPSAALPALAANANVVPDIDAFIDRRLRITARHMRVAISRVKYETIEHNGRRLRRGFAEITAVATPE